MRRNVPRILSHVSTNQIEMVSAYVDLIEIWPSKEEMGEDADIDGIGNPSALSFHLQ